MTPRQIYYAKYRQTYYQVQVPYTYFQKIAYVILGGLFCSWIFYLRFIKVRIPHEIIFTWSPWAALGTLFMVSIFGLSLCTVLTGNTERFRNGVLQKLAFGLTVVLAKSLHKVHMHVLGGIDDFFANKVVKKDRAAYRLQNFITERIFFNRWRTWGGDVSGEMYPLRRVRVVRRIYSLIIQVPATIVAITFFIDVIIYHYFYYLYAMLPLLIIPTTFRILFYIYKWELRGELVKYHTIFELHRGIHATGCEDWKCYKDDDADKKLEFFGEKPSEDWYEYYAESFIYYTWVDEDVIDVTDKAHLYPIYKNFTILNLSLYLNGWLYIFIGILNAP